MYQLFEYLHDCICILNKDNEIIFCNTSFLNQLKYKNLVGQSLGEIILPNQKWLKDREVTLKKSLLTIKTADADEIIFSVDQVKSIVNHQEVDVLILHPYAEFYHTKEDLEHLLDQLPYHIWLKNSQLEYTYVNKKYANWIYPHKNKLEILGQSESLYWPPDLIKYFKRTDTQVLKDNKSLIIPEVLNIKDTEVHWNTHKIPISNDSDQTKLILGFTWIPPDSSQLEVSLAHANRQLNILYDITKSPVTHLNAEGILQHLSTLIAGYLNASALCIFEHDTLTHELVTCAVQGDFTSLLPVSTRLSLTEEAFNMMMSAQDAVHFFDIKELSPTIPFYKTLVTAAKELNLHHFCRYLIKDSNELLGVIWVGYTGPYEPLTLQDDFIKTLCSQIHSIIKNTSLLQKAQEEIKKRKIAEEQALHLEKAMAIESMKNEFFTNISHELKTPINILLSTNDLLNYFHSNDMISTSIDVDFSKYIQIMRQNAYRLLRLINNLIDITKIDAGEYPLHLATYNIIHIIEETTLSIHDYIQSKNIDLVFDTDIEEYSMLCDAERIERIMLNLLSNAVKYSNPGDKIYVNITHTSALLRITVQDTGIGIPTDKLNFIFQRFGQVNTTLTRPAEGSGIGLSLVHALVEMHKGQISVTSTLGEGSTFTIEFPIKDLPSFLEYSPKRMDPNFALSQNAIERCHIEFSDIYF